MKPPTSRISGFWILVVLAAVAGSASCSDRAITEVDADLLAARVQPCTRFCEKFIGPCGPGPERSYASVAECMKECATVDGIASQMWAYDQASKQDLCFDEAKEDLDCLSSLSCEDFMISTGEGAQQVSRDQRPCAEFSHNVVECFAREKPERGNSQ
jgi:hypothetical protein